MRTARKIKRYRKELSTGVTKGNKSLTALEVARRVDTLLAHGERLRDIRKLAKPWTQQYNEKEMTELLTEMHPVFNFRADAYRFVGIRNETLVSAGVLKKVPRRGVRKGGRKK